MHDHDCNQPTNDPGVRRVFDRIMDLTDSQRCELFDLMRMHKAGQITQEDLNEYGGDGFAEPQAELAIFVERIQFP